MVDFFFLNSTSGSNDVFMQVSSMDVYNRGVAWGFSTLLNDEPYNKMRPYVHVMTNTWFPRYPVFLGYPPLVW